MKFFLKTLLKVLLWVLLLLLLFLVTSGIVQQKFRANKYTGFFGIGYAVVVSGSMIPALQINDMIFYHAHPGGEYSVGDVIVYRAERPEGEILITHRIVRFENGSVVTLGDANHGNEDEPFPPEKIVGKVVFRIPNAGKLVNFIRTVPGIIISALVIVGLAVANLFLTSRNMKRRKTETVSGQQRIRY